MSCIIALEDSKKSKKEIQEIQQSKSPTIRDFSSINTIQNDSRSISDSNKNIEKIQFFPEVLSLDKSSEEIICKIHLVDDANMSQDVYSYHEKKKTYIKKFERLTVILMD